MSLEIETDRAIYELQFRYFQVEITGKCNMTCQHCRATTFGGDDMPIEQFQKIVRFGKKFLESNGEVVVSGGEPFLHRKWKSVLSILKEEGIQNISITTNGLCFTEKTAQFVNDIGFDNVVISVSVDSTIETEHNGFRGHYRAFERAHHALEILRDQNMRFAIRATILPENIREMEKLVVLAENMGCGFVGFSAVHPVGRALQNPSLLMDASRKKAFLCEVDRLRREHQQYICIGTNDPLFSLVCRTSESGRRNGCGAAAVTFNVNADGTMTPCALMNTPIMNTFTEEDIERSYISSEIVHRMLDMDFDGKCGSCKSKMDCGGCRARALADGNPFGEDPHCFK